MFAATLVLLTTVVAAAPASAASVPGGPVILDGNDPYDHQSAISSYVQNVYASLDANLASGYVHNGTTAIIGNSYCQQMLQNMLPSRSFQTFDTAAEVRSLFSGIGSNNYAHIHICSDDDPTLPSAVEAELDLWGASIATHVNRGGGLFATGHSFNWLKDLFPSLVVAYGGTSSSYVTADGAAFFPTLNENDYVGAINHYTFDNVATTTLRPLLSQYQNGGGKLVAIGGTTVRFPQISLTGPSLGAVGTDATYRLVAADADGSLLSNNSFTYTISGVTDSAVTDATATTDANGEYVFTFTGNAVGSTRLKVQMTLSSGTAAGTAISTDWVEPPGAPTDVAAVDVTGEDGSVSVTWNAPISDGGSALTDYVVQYSTDATTWVTVDDGTSTTRATKIGGLTNATDYTFRVAAVNAVAQGPWSATATGTPAGSPDLPDLHTVNGSDASVWADWDAPAADNGAPVTSYVVESSRSGESNWTRLTPDPTATEATITGLVNGQGYDVRVAAVNSNGQGPWSNVMTATPFTTPDAVQRLAVEEADGGLTFVWTEPGFDGGAVVTAYQVTSDLGPCTPEHWHPDSAGHEHWYRCRYTGLTNGDRYAFNVAAVNAAGAGASSSVSGSPYGTPFAPTVTVTDGDGQSRIDWTAADGNGREVTGYDVHVDGQLHASLDATARTLALTGLDNGSVHTVSVAARNVAGVGQLATADARPYTLPDAPLVSMTEGDEMLDVSWTTPDGNGRDVTGYVIDVDGQEYARVPDTSNRLVVAGLTNGELITVSVRAINAAGEGPHGSTTGSPLTVPDAPAARLDKEGDGTATIGWAPPVDTGGRRITGYDILVDGIVIQHVDAARRAAAVDGLVNGRTYRIGVRAVTAAGAGPAASVPATPYGAPGPVGEVKIRPGHESLHVSWEPPADTGGREVTGYVVQYRVKGGAWMTAGETTETSLTITGLDDGLTYEVRVLSAGLGGTSLPTGHGSFTQPAALAHTGVAAGFWLVVALGALTAGIVMVRRRPNVRTS